MSTQNYIHLRRQLIPVAIKLVNHFSKYQSINSTAQQIFTILMNLVFIVYISLILIVLFVFLFTHISLSLLTTVFN